MSSSAVLCRNNVTEIKNKVPSFILFELLKSAVCFSTFLPRDPCCPHCISHEVQISCYALLTNLSSCFLLPSMDFSCYFLSISSCCAVNDLELITWDHWLDHVLGRDALKHSPPHLACPVKPGNATVKPPYDPCPIAILKTLVSKCALKQLWGNTPGDIWGVFPGLVCDEGSGWAKHSWKFLFQENWECGISILQFYLNSPSGKAVFYLDCHNIDVLKMFIVLFLGSNRGFGSFDEGCN